MLLSLDPSSSRTGYAIYRDPEPSGLIESGAIIAETSDRTPLDRVVTMGSALQQLISDHNPTAAVIEIPSSHVSARHHGRGAGLATYGFAVGWLGCMAALLIKSSSITWVDNSWTGSESAKRRAARISLLFPHYEARRDRGGDECDALALGLWYGARQRLQRTTAGH